MCSPIHPLWLFCKQVPISPSLVKGSSPTPDSAWLTSLFWKEEAKAGSFSWFERVPSPSNPADGPSRGVPPPDLVIGEASVKAREVALPPGFEALITRKWVPRINTEKGAVVQEEFK